VLTRHLNGLFHISQVIFEAVKLRSGRIVGGGGGGVEFPSCGIQHFVIEQQFRKFLGRDHSALWAEGSTLLLNFVDRLPIKAALSPRKKKFCFAFCCYPENRSKKTMYKPPDCGRALDEKQA
jgi:hypothetical protein